MAVAKNWPRGDAISRDPANLTRRLTAMTIAQPRTPDTRELRALELYRARRHDILRVAPEVYLVPSCTGEGAYRVHYGEHESCSCPDHAHHPERACKHILASTSSV
jgi:hypothetical protein